MIEKVFDKTYRMKGSGGIPQATLTRIANRMLDEYKEVDGFNDVPEELKAVADKIRQSKESKDYEYEYSVDTPSHGQRTYDTCKTTYEYRAHAFWDEDEYGEPLYHVTWYFFFSEWYTKHIADKNIMAGSYHDITSKVTAAKGKYRYFCTHRPPSPGIIPAGWVSYDTYGRGEHYIGEVTYNEQPPSEELRNWGLIPDEEWEIVRKAYAQIF